MSEVATMTVAGVRFRGNWRVYDFDPNGLALSTGRMVIVDSERGNSLATVVRIRKRIIASEPVRMEQGIQIEEEPAEKEDKAARKEPAPLRRILRIATDEDLERDKSNRQREADAFKLASQVITERDLAMKLIRVEYSIDSSRATFFFFSESRIDFRDLVKDLAFKLKSRIEMRQIGVRDVARMIGGFGLCGRELCCSAFLTNFEPVSIRMAKKQDMVLNPAKISGVCGRLLCCLSYEFEMYDAIKKDIIELREAAAREKREAKEAEDQRIADERREEEKRFAEDKKRRAEKRPQTEPRGDKKKEERKDAAKPEQRRDQKQEKKAQPTQEQRKPRREGAPDAEQRRDKRPDHQRRKPEKEKTEQKEPKEQREPKQQPSQPPAAQPDNQTPTAGGEESAAKRKKKRFWRKKKSGGAGESKPQPTPSGQ